MTEAEAESFRQRRVRRADSIRKHPNEYKACECCRSVSRRSVATCPVCGAYRWDESADAVEASVTAAEQSVFPATLGYAPSFPRDYGLPFG